ncbi:hypothetical protein DI09_559p10 [Mitosporidium daphniae]|uniref:Uncharacterized protein n=1 Tax=Mitosporidium daphniae TaxID=1485682 RepID=A0A098VPB9_9MICR|nr:uncharacterized protein DI09_559p10 [Mitosporidium daphniae]KGG50805.1 hypothetical protein DI09_559p10 [Mitosporidium daphniae]|eukprot:XP_013237241.1 uncharacterized protein DI09_559p10 [Mitosporidium daphniae]
MDDTFNILERVNILLIGFLAFLSCEFSFSNVGYFLLFLGIYVYVPKHSDNSDAKQVKNDKNSHLKEEKTDENSGVGKEKKKDENGQNNPNPIAPT